MIPSLTRNRTVGKGDGKEAPFLVFAMGAKHASSWGDGNGRKGGEGDIALHESLV